ncbi:zinc finger C3H1 domain-containing protein isoform X2 [Hemicordylus capensis]|uniref:zinc finger C3H1 domain-containing protein isoform X2 n=1 Tax=Hemicordylus capensis TaxID=884348 RepID=UPI0023033109|nr:zinc finger C3H1 domain-containing protein isoform X2 [Hemicordylus capensis]
MAAPATEEETAAAPSGLSPKEEGELEDGEISDDDNNDGPPEPSHRGGDGGGPNATSASSSKGPPARRRPPPELRGSLLLSSSRRFPHLRHQPPPAAGHLHGHSGGGGYRLKEPFRPHPPQPPPSSSCSRLPPGAHSDSGPRLSFWERSHNALDRFRFRGRPYRGGGRWGRSRGGVTVGRPPGGGGGGGGGGYSGNQGWREPSPRKSKIFGKSPSRKNYSFKNDNSVEESFEDLLLKYKQIQLELEYINKDEKLALNNKEETVPQGDSETASPKDQITVDDVSITKDAVNEVSPEEKNQVLTFQAFELKPLRQKLPTLAERSKLKKVKDGAKPPPPPKSELLDANQVDEKEQGEQKLSLSDVAAEKKLLDEEEEMSELQLRLLALQSASKKWQQKEQQVMKESKEKLTKAKTVQPKVKTCATKSHSAKKTSTAAKQALRKQQTKVWKKLQQQKEQERRQKEEEQRKQEEEEERRKREEEIRKIRDLSNQEEQYNRFMKLVGGKRRSGGKSSDKDLRWSLDKQSTESAGGIYQYDNYDEVAMDTESETNSPASSPVQPPYFECPVGYFPPALPQMSLPLAPPVSTLPPMNQMYMEDISSVSLESLPPLPPLPPEEPEQPPKPPFADEEEEEEMLLREELLKSLANKRAFKPEENSNNNGPPSPPFPINSYSVPRSNLSAVSINTVSQPRVKNTKIIRVPRAPRTVIALPKHKSVVVTLNDSDDSESDAEQPNSATSVFGGLESMIKEARRTVEASKPKAPLKSEKENNPMKTPEALPEDKKIEYRLLKEEIASREKQRLIISEPLKTSSSPVNSDAEVDGAGRIAIVTKQVTDAEAKLKKHKLLLLKDESVLKHLLQQEAKKKESVRLAESKIAKLNEQLQAAAKILNANKVFLKKLQEQHFLKTVEMLQIHRVQQRVTVKKALALKYGEELARAKALASKEIGKRKLDHHDFCPNKILKMENSPSSSPKKHSAELIALEKKRLQQLQYEYALKIQQLKEAQAHQMKDRSNVVPIAEEEPEFALPQPSLHDLTQDKLTLDIEENYFDDEILSNSNRERRRSFRESGSFTKPNLKHVETPKQETANKLAKKTLEQPELFLGLNIDELKKLYVKADGLKQVLEKSATLIASNEGNSCGQEITVDVDPFTVQSEQTEGKPYPFGPYHSPLLVFKSYRFSPYFRTKEKLYLSSVSYSNMIEPKQCFCRFDLTGTCNDDDCQWQHMKDCSLSRRQLFEDVLSYNLALIGCSEKNTDEEISAATEKYVEKLFGVNKDRMSMDQMAVLLVSNINESKSHTPPFTTWKDKRKWRPKYSKKTTLGSGSSSEEDQSSGPIKYAPAVENKIRAPALDAVVTPDDVRYFTNETDDISNLEASVLENPYNVQLWIKLAYKYLNQNEGSSSECLDSSLNVLARALENNKENSEIWCHYLKLFSKRGTKEEVQEMCETAVEYAPTYTIWWTFLNLENTFDGKDYVCGRMLQFLMERPKCEENLDLQSFQLLEMLLYRVNLSLFTGKQQNAVALFQNALKSASDKVIVQHLTVSDRCLAWLSYIHLIEFGGLPAKFYDPGNSNPSKMMKKEPFLIPWKTTEDVKTNHDMLLAVFEDAIQSCSSEDISASERVALCLPLYRNLIALQQLLEKWEDAIELCISLLKLSPVDCQLLEALVALYLRTDQIERACDVWLTAFERNPQNAQVFFHMCKFFILQNRSDSIPPLLQAFVAAFFKCVHQENTPVELLRYFLNFPVPIEFTPPLYKGGFTEEVVNQQIPYLWQIYCLYQSLHGSSGEAADAYEAALGAVMQEEIVQHIWMDYLIFINGKVVRSNNQVQEFKLFSDLVNRCLVTVPTRYPIPFSTADYWTSYEFHNKVIFFYLSCIPKSQHSKALERFCSTMPANPGLALRLLQQYWEESNVQILKLQAKMFTYNIPTCLPIWKIAIAAECFLKGQREVHHLYQRAFQKLPLCATLWKDQLLFEASGGGKTDNLRKLVSKCQEVGVSLDELLNLNTFRTESTNR